MSPAPTSERSSKPVASSRFERVRKELILPNPWNPNRMTTEMYAKALESISEFGMIDPLLCREMGDHYQIIDGEHRYRAACDLGHVEFAHAVWSGSNRHRANVSDANFEGVEMATVNMEYANCSEAKNVDIPPYKDHVR